MPSPFPGMDPYLEGSLWPDVHSALASKLRQQLVPLLRPRYVARLGLYVVEDTAPEGEIGILYPDVEVLSREEEGSPVAEAVMTPPALSVPVTLPVEVQVTNVEIRDAASRELVACIEIISPVNKREPSLTPYRFKRQRLYRAGVHLIELDLIRRGTRPAAHPSIPEAAYVIMLTRARTGKTDVWPLTLPDALPTVPVPLRSPDADVPLDVQAALEAVYDEAAYDLTLDYRQAPPPPALSDEDTRWMRKWVLRVES